MIDKVSEAQVLLKTSNADIAKRLAIIMKENDLAYRGLADILNNGSKDTITYATVFHSVTNKHKISRKLVSRICYVMGYSPNWILSGRGEKKVRKEDTKIITDIQQFRVELSMRDAEIDILKSHVDLLFKMVEDLKK